MLRGDPFRTSLAARRNTQGGYILVIMLVFGGIALVMLGSLVNLALLETRAGETQLNGEKAFQVAEAGANYYRWHLAHAPLDYKDGTNSSGPYIHDYADKNNVVIGRYSLQITPPPVGSTLVTVDSTGYLLSNVNQKKTVRVQFAIPSVAKFVVVSNDNMRYGAGTEVFGLLHSNGGTRFDGIAHNIVESAQTCYDDPDTSGGGSCERPGVWTSVSPSSGVFLAGTQFPVPAVDFGGIAVDLAGLKTEAQAQGKYFAPSGKLGYHIILKSNDTFDLYKVTKLESLTTNCKNAAGTTSWSIQTETFVANYAFPADGVIFVEDDLWVEGTLDSARLIIGAGYFPSTPSTDKSITVNRNLSYAHQNGSESLGLIAQKDVNVGWDSADDLNIDGALVAVAGRVGRPYYGDSSCTPFRLRNSITLYGMIASYSRYGFAYTDGTGYQTRNLNYDSNLLYSPPPQFPLTTDQYSVISWREVLP